MPSALTYPGVYIEEIPSGVRTISGVATSITAFAGWAAKGNVDPPPLIQSWSDFERQFGGLDPKSLLGHSVYQFFNNGGQQAYIVRLTAENANTAKGELDGKLRILASSPGNWGNLIKVKSTKRNDDEKKFTLSVTNTSPDGKQESVVEVFDNLSVLSDDPRFVGKVLEDGSSFIRAELLNNPTESPEGTVSLEDGDDGAPLEPNTEAFHKALESGGGKKGINLLDRIDIFNLLCVPGETDQAQVQNLQNFCRTRRAFLIVDSEKTATYESLLNVPAIKDIAGDNSINAAFYFPWIKAPDPLKEGRIGEFPPCGFVAGLYAKTDSLRGVWKAPAGVDVSLTGAAGIKQVLTDMENGQLNIKGINCLRSFPVYGNVVWGARTLRGNNEIGSEWKYIPVRRTALFIEESLYRGTKWVVFEPNDEPLWAQIRLNVGAFMQNLFRQGAFQGRSPREAYLVKCDRETTTQNDINLGIVNILVGFAPLKPAEFVVIKIQQLAGQIET
jgi:phage tail sheath protein FI